VSAIMQLAFFKKGGYSLRSGRLEGRFSGCCYEYQIECCEKYQVFLQTPSLDTDLEVEIMGDMAWDGDCGYHCHVDLVLQRKEEGQFSATVKYVVAKLDESCSFSLAFHKPFNCSCPTYVKFSYIRDRDGYYSVYAMFKIV
jgi:hypothetical protein